MNSNATTNEAENTCSSTKRLAAIIFRTTFTPLIIISAILFIGCGWLLVATTFSAAAAFAAVGISGIIGAFVNSVNGIGAIMITIGGSLFAFGLTLPIFNVARALSRSFSVFRRDALKKIKEIHTLGEN
jgi:uncharacterized membrane protein